MSGGTSGMLLAVADDRVTPGVLGFIVVALLGVATWLLIRSMNRQLRKVDFPERERERGRGRGRGGQGGAGTRGPDGPPGQG